MGGILGSPAIWLAVFYDIFDNGPKIYYNLLFKSIHVARLLERLIGDQNVSG